MSIWREVKAVLFDWGGTLARIGREEANWTRCSAAAAEAVINDLSWGFHAAGDMLNERFAATRQLAVRDAECHEIDMRRLFAEWGEEVGLGSPEDWSIDRAIEAFWETWIGALEPIEGAADVLAELKQRGYRLGLVSNVTAPPDVSLKELTRQGMARWMEAFTFSSGVGYRKPHARFYEAALDAFRAHGPRPATHEILFVGDGPLHDVRGPQQLGMHTAMVRYDGIAWPENELRDARPDMRIDHIRDLLPHLPPL
jgi:HAD superfamily hydrolase (TIGR01549 family)